MTRPTVLPDDELAAAVRELPGWSLVDAKLHAEFRFADFAEAFGFMAAVATEAARLDHHPEWSNVYSRVVVDLVTHDAGGITELDVQLARRMSALAGASISSLPAVHAGDNWVGEGSQDHRAGRSVGGHRSAGRVRATTV